MTRKTSRRAFLQDGIAGSLALATLPSLSPVLLAQSSGTRDELWYRQPATRWLEALPVGNGFLGGMVYGGTQMECIALSEATAWSGAPGTNEVNPGALPHLHQMRQLFFDGKYDKFQQLCSQYLPGRMKNFGTNLPLPEVQFAFDNSDRVSEYRRSLDLDTAIAGVRFRSGDATFTREVIASHPHQLLAVRFTCSKPGRIRFRMDFGKGILPGSVTAAHDTLVFEGHAYERLHSSGHDGVALQIHARLLADGGTVTPAADAIEVRGAHSVTVLVAIATSFRGGDPESTCQQRLNRAREISFLQLRRAHIADHQPLYRRVSLDLGRSSLGQSSSSARQLPTDARRKALEDGADDPELLALFFQYGRYLTIAGSRADSQLPLALQGIWNDGLASSMGWTDDFHLDINTQQNYWPAEVANLSECQMPLFALIDGMRAAGRTTAREMYGARGWVVHTVTNPWGYTAPGAGVGWGIFVTAGIWIALQMWEHYTFTADVDFLRTRAYPVLREAALFFLDSMVPEPKHGWLVTGPSDSPENWYKTPGGGRAAESMGNTIDRVFVYALYTMCIQASKTLSIDDDLRQRLESARAKLPPFQIGRHGQLQEWLEDFEDAEPNHRHTSPLVSVYPEHQISPRTTPALSRAAEVLIQRRMDAPHWEQSEWGRANLVVYYARFLKGDDAHKYLVGLVAKAADANLLTFSSAGVAGADQNIFAIDGNTAGTAGIAEMLLQSQAGYIEVLPALPAAWPNGSVRGLCARGGFVVDIEWRAGKLISATVRSRHGGSTPVRYAGHITTLHLGAGESLRLRQDDFRQPAVDTHESEA
ncbi:MAG TPA: glycoside hydrolase family 95 protein [Acidobacteriaceae bacterium]|nr:glycoside hydrolase family 95 protein [Acidobacteriaceae bacterium]